MPQPRITQATAPPRWGVGSPKLYQNVASKVSTGHLAKTKSAKPFVVAQPRVSRNFVASKKPAETKQQMSTSMHRNAKISSIGSSNDAIYENIKISAQNDKLKSALTNFDRIISEYNQITVSTDNLANNHRSVKQQPRSISIPSTPAAIPKLQKSKTCSIIEAHCILKQPSPRQSLCDVKTRLVRKTLQASPSLLVPVGCNVQKAKSVWDVSAAPPKVPTRARSSSCVRTPSRIPVKKPQRHPIMLTPAHQRLRATSADPFPIADRKPNVVRVSPITSCNPIKACVEKFEKRCKDTNAAQSASAKKSPAAEVMSSRRAQMRRGEMRYLEPIPFESCRILSQSPAKSAVAIRQLSDVAAVYKESSCTREYSSDCSDDSGHISNENEPPETPRRITELLAKFERRKASVDQGFVEATPYLQEESPKKEVLLRAGTLGALESRRDALLTARVTALQARCRGVLARRKCARLRVQTLAVRCVQRNVRAFLAVRDWPWWRLLVRVTPLLNVHRTEEQLKAKMEELETLRTKFDKLESERTVLKHENDRLESKLSEMTADLAEEHSTATVASERLEAEASERVRLERDLQEAQTKNKGLQQASERLEMELLYARSDLNGTGTHSDSEDGSGEPGAYRQRYERAQRELEFTRRRLQQQHEDDLEQLVGLKKQLEKKLSDAYEEVEEQRQVAGQWKRKAQKLTSEQNDLRLLLEQRGARNALLEKRQRRHDAELQHGQEELRQERANRERAQREKDVMAAEKDGLEQSLQDLRLELDLKEERLTSLRRELDEPSSGSGGRADEELAALRKIKSELEHKTRDQEEELDDLAGQVQLLEQHKLRLEMTLENARKEGRHEAQQRDEELEEARANAQKKLKALESQLESEHEERTLLLREKHELERRLAAAEEVLRTDRQVDAEAVLRLKRDLKRTRALLRDAQTQLERQRQDGPSRAALRQLRNQLEDAEAARAAAMKARSALDAELAEAQAAHEEASRARTEADSRAAQAIRERAELRGQLDENEEELAEVMKKYRTAVQQLGVEQRTLSEQAARLSDAEREVVSLKENVSELTARLEAAETLGDPHNSLNQKRMELRVKELESKLELEQTTRGRLEVQMNRHKEALERATLEAAAAQSKEQHAQDVTRKLQRSIRELRDEYQTLATREAECLQKRKELEKRLECSEAESATARADLRLALQRIEDLQMAMQEGELTSSENSESDHDSCSSDESIETFLANNKISRNSTDKPTMKVSPRTSTSHDTSPRIRVTAGTPSTPPYKENNSSFA